MKRVLVTGANGFVGANLVRRMLDRGHEVHALVRPGSDGWRLDEVRSHLRVHEADMRDAEAVRRAVAASRPEWVLHLAAYGSHSWETDAETITRTNVGGTVTLVEACRAVGFERFVNTGSSSEYGFKDHAPSEDEACEPNSDYAVAKVAATEYCRRAARSEGLSIATFRLYSVYGPWESPHRLIPTLILRGLEGELPPLVKPETARDFIYVDDVCDAYEACLGADDGICSGIYNVGTGVQTAIRQVVDVARRRLVINAETRWSTLPDRCWDTETWICDPTRIGRNLGWRARHDLGAGFAATIAWLTNRNEVRDCYSRMMATPADAASKQPGKIRQDA